MNSVGTEMINMIIIALNRYSMHTSKTVSDLNYHLDFEREKGQKIGFVPTMGALHQGHLSLVTQAKAECDKVVCSIFVNPTQFNDIKDLEQYPRMPAADMAMLNEAGCHFVFLPEVKEIYTAGEPLLDINFGALENTMEGTYRPGHFRGVATVVDKLFRIVKPSKAYFGEKDFQQLAVIRRMEQFKSHSVEIVGCPTLRENDGLAMSSRNLLLTPEQREAAPLIYKALMEGNDFIGQVPFSTVKAKVIEKINANPFLKVQYFDIVHPDTLITIKEDEYPAIAQGCIAVLTSGPRLIDNVTYRLQ